MSAPILETSTDLAREQATIKLVESFWDVRAVKMKKFYHADYALTVGGDNRVKGFAEIKCRKTASGEYSTYMLSEEKIRWATQTHQLFKVPCFLVVAWSDRTGYVRIDDNKYNLFLSGRMDEHDGAESEPCVLIPVKYFKEVKP